MQPPLVVVKAEEQGSYELVLPGVVPPKARHDAAAAILLAIAALACIVPAGRALRVDPAVLLRSV